MKIDLLNECIPLVTAGWGSPPYGIVTRVPDIFAEMNHYREYGLLRRVVARANRPLMQYGAGEQVARARFRPAVGTY